MGRPNAWNAAAVPAAQPVPSAVPMTRAEVMAPPSAEKHGASLALFHGRKRVN